MKRPLNAITRVVSRRVLAACSALAVSGCGLFPSPGPSSQIAGQGSAPGYFPTVAAPIRNRGICIDPTLSTVPTFSREVLALVGSVVAGWAGPAPPETDTGPLPAQPGLHLVVRQVGTSSYASDNSYTVVDVSAVQGLLARPDVTGPDFVDEDRVWRAARNDVVAAARRAERQAVAGAAVVRSIRLNDRFGVYSEVAGCVTALADTMPPGPRSILLASDLEQNRPPQADHALGDTSVVVVQPCESGNAAACGGLRDWWRHWLMAQGAVSVRFVRPEVAASAVPTLLKGGSS